MPHRCNSKHIPPIISALALLAFSACSKYHTTEPGEPPDTDVDRHASIPSDMIKITPGQDNHPPILHSTEFQEPIPLPIISTAGAEDAPFIPIDREELYFFFAADVRDDPSVQIRDPANGIWVSQRVGGAWQEPSLVWLQTENMLALNGCPFVAGNELFFCTARTGYTGVQNFKAEWVDGAWRNFALYTFTPSFQVGELHIHGDQLYYHSYRLGGQGGLDIWSLSMTQGFWATPVNIEVVNSAEDDSRPYISQDGHELWFTRTYLGTPAVYRSRLMGEEWQEPELIVSQFAGEPTLDAQGNLYFVHHFYEDGVMLEADIYVANRIYGGE